MKTCVDCGHPDVGHCGPNSVCTAVVEPAGLPPYRCFCRLRDEQHERLRQFLEDVAFNLNDLLACENDPVFYEPIIRTKADRITVGKGSRIDGFVKLEGGERLEIGRYVHIASFAHIGIGGGVTIIEDCAAVASGGKIISGSNKMDALSVSAVAPAHLQRIESSVTRLSKYSCVFTNGVVCPGVTLHEGAVLLPGGVATKDIPAWEIWGGTPAKFVARRQVK